MSTKTPRLRNLYLSLRFVPNETLGTKMARGFVCDSGSSRKGEQGKP